jgi:hypothetical protein
MKLRSRIRNLLLGGENRLEAEGSWTFAKAISGQLEINDPAFGRNRDGLRPIISTQFG